MWRRALFRWCRERRGRAPVRGGHDPVRWVFGEHVVSRRRRRRRRVGDSARLRHRRHHRERRRARPPTRAAAEAPDTRVGEVRARRWPLVAGLSRRGSSSPCSRRGGRLADARPARARARQVALAARRRGGRPGHRGGLVELDARGPAGRHHLRGQHRVTCSPIRWSAIPTGHVEHGAGRSGCRVGAFVARGHATVSSAGSFPPGWSLVKIFARRAAHGRGRARRRRLQHQPGPHQLGDASVGSLVTFASMGAGAWLTLWALYLRKS